MTGSANAVAIVGMSCRMPGAADLDSYRQMLGDGRAAVGGAPAGPENITERADFLGTAAEFDADFFGIAPDEAQAIDSRHLWALELGWEALGERGRGRRRTRRPAVRCLRIRRRGSRHR